MSPTTQSVYESFRDASTQPALPASPLDQRDAAPPTPSIVRTSPPRLDLAKTPTVRLDTASVTTAAPEVALLVQPASPARSSTSSLAGSSQPPSPHSPSSFVPPSPSSASGSLAARRKAKKQLSLLVPAAPSAASSSALLSPAISTFKPGSADEQDGYDSETRSLPPSPVSLQAFIGPEGREPDDRTIGRLMMKQQAEEMRVQMKGNRNMKRRTSIPQLSLGVNPAPTAAKPTGPGSLVQLLRRTSNERVDSAIDDDVEEFPYQHGPREILSGIYLGSEQNARDPQVLRKWSINYVLNVAKEVECPWLEEVIVEEGEESDEAASKTRNAQVRTKHPRPKARSPAKSPVEGPEVVPPMFMRPTASTPNLHAMFSTSPSSPAPPPLPPLPRQYSDGASPVSDSQGVSSSPPRTRKSPPRRRKGDPARDAVRFPANSMTGRPTLEYLWLKWGHDESDLVEALKFQAAFDFLDEARASAQGQGRVLVHCQCGVSRSATVVIAYCMREAAKALEEGRELTSELSGCTGMHDTYSFVKEKSEWVGPNLGLVFQLVAYERTLRGGADAYNDEEDDSTYPYGPQMAAAERDAAPVAVNSPRTPLWSEGSSASDSHLSTPEVDTVIAQSSVVPNGRCKALPSLSVLVPPRKRVEAVGADDSQEILSPTSMTARLSLDELGTSSVASLPTAGTFVLPAPPSRLRSTHLSPDAADAIYEDMASPTTASRPTFAPGSLTIDTIRASRTNSSDRLPTPQPRTSSSGQSSTATLKLNSPALSSPGTATSAQSRTFGASQTPKERRASHRRVFSDTVSIPAFLKRGSSPSSPLPATGN